MGFFSDIKTIFGNVRGASKLVDEVNVELKRTCGVDIAMLPSPLQKQAMHIVHRAYYNSVNPSAPSLAKAIHIMLIGEGWNS